MIPFLGLVILFFSNFQLVWAINTVDTGFKVDPNELKTIVAHGVCKKVWNQDVRSHFVATKTNVEWTNFYVNHPTPLTVRDCSATCSNLKKMGLTVNGIHALDIDGAGALPVMNLFCDVTSDGGGWTRVFRHNVAGGVFATPASALNTNPTDPANNKYSILDLLDNFRSLNRLTFRLYWPENNKRNIWSQYTNPTKDTALMGYQAISIDTSARHWGGLELSNKSTGVVNSSQSLLDGSVEKSDWWYAIGSTVLYAGTGIPGSNLTPEVVSEVQLFVNDGGYNPMSCQHILEMGESKGSGLYTIYPDQVNPILTYCEMDVDGGGWTLFYANAANSGMTVKKSYLQHQAELAGINITASNFSDVNTVGMLNYKKFSANQIMARDIGNWTASQFSTVEFQNPQDLTDFINIASVPITGACKNLPGAGMFRFRNSNGSNYWFDQMNNFDAANVGLGWGDCTASLDQTDASDVENYPRHWFYSISGATDSTRVRGIGGFNLGSTTAKARYFIREKLDRPKNCMDILLSGHSKGSGSYTIYPEGTAVTVDCDMVTQGGGWTKVWHGYPSHARYNNTTLETYSRSNSIAFNQMRMEGVNTGVNIVDTTWKTAYLDKTIPLYFQQVIAAADATQPQVKFADLSGAETVGLVGQYFMKGYGNSWRVFYTCINVDPTTADRLYIGGSYSPKCPSINTFVPSSITTCTSTNNFYCTNAMASTEVDSGMGLTLKKYQETRVWIRSLSTMRSCKEILDRGFATGNGFYLIDPDGAAGATEAFPVYCDMTSQGGGWTLVWSNTRLGTNKPVTSITYADSVNTRPRCSVAQSSVYDFSGSCSSMLNDGGQDAPLLERFNYFVGLKHWDDMSAGTDFELRYAWAADYGRSLDREAIMRVKNFDPADLYRLTILSNRTTIGSDVAGINNHSGNRWTTMDSDNDTHASNCGTLYSNTPFWYYACWTGSINGGGETNTTTYLNGAHWISSGSQWGDPVSGLGAGNGWMFIREAKTEGRLKSSCKEILKENPGSPSGLYTIDFTPGTPSNKTTVYCDMTTSGGGWTLVAFSNGTATAATPNNFFVSEVNVPYIGEMTKANYQASLNPENFSLSVGTTDAMFISPSYNGGVPIIDTNFGPWDYNKTKCSGTLYHTSRTAGCASQNANDNYESADAFNISFFSGNEGIVPAYKATEVCYNGKGSCSFKFFLR